MVLLAQSQDIFRWIVENYGLLGVLAFASGLLLYRLGRGLLTRMENRTGFDDAQRQQMIKNYEDQRRINMQTMSDQRETIRRLEIKIDATEKENDGFRDELSVLHERYSQLLLEKQELQWKLDLCLQQTDIQFDANDEIITRKPQKPE